MPIAPPVADEPGNGVVDANLFAKPGFDMVLGNKHAKKKTTPLREELNCVMLVQPHSCGTCIEGRWEFGCWLVCAEINPNRKTQFSVACSSFSSREKGEKLVFAQTMCSCFTAYLCMWLDCRFSRWHHSNRQFSAFVVCLYS